MIYGDPSFLFSLYCLDANSPTAAATYGADQRRPLFLTAWQRFELANAVRLGVHKLERAETAVPFQPGNVFKRVREDLAAGRLRHAEVDWNQSFLPAEELSAEHTERLGTASADIWHVAAAVLPRADTFWTFDGVQHELAARIGSFRNVPVLVGR